MKLVTVLLFCVYTCSAQVVPTTLTYSVSLPQQKTNKTPVLILLHGYGSNESDLFNFGSRLDGRCITFSLRGPLTTRDGGYCWYQLGFEGGGNFRYNYQETVAARNKVLSFISNACRVYGVDSTRVYVLGFSQGAMLAYDLALAAPGKIGGVMALSGKLMTESKRPNTSPAITRVRFFIGHGTTDDVIKIDESSRAMAYLREKRVTDIRLKIYPMPHTISGKELEDLRAWLQGDITAN